MFDTIFREYDIRGIVGKEFDLSQVNSLSYSIAYYFLHQTKFAVKTVAVGMDGRIDSPKIKQELINGLIDSGLNVIFIGVCPTPVLYFALHTLPVDAGIMITASHNGKEYNGFKICLSKDPVWGTQISYIRELYKQKRQYISLHKGEYKEHYLVDIYIDWLVNQFKFLKDFPISIVIDCGNGATGVVIPKLIEKLKFNNVSILYADLDGSFPNHDPDPVNVKNMFTLQKLVREKKAIGIAFDGDGDRMVPFTYDGEPVAGDKMVALYAQEIIKKRPNAGIVFDVKCSAVLPKLLSKWGCKPYVVPSGHSIIKHAMKKNRALLAGELSCHFFFCDKYFGYDDGIYAALRLLELMHDKDNYDLENLLDFFPLVINTPEIRIAYVQNRNNNIMDYAYNFFLNNKDAQICRLDGVKAVLPYGWGLVRYSNTQPALTFRFESSTKEGLKQIQKDFCYMLKDNIDITALEKSISELN